MKRFSVLKNKKALLIVPVLAVASVIGVSANRDNSSYSLETESQPAQAEFEEEQKSYPESYSSADGYVNPYTQSYSPDETEGPTEPAPEPSEPAPEGEPAPEPEPEPVPPHITGVTERYEYSTKPDGKYKTLYCDYSYSDGSVKPVQKATTKVLGEGESGLEIQLSC